MDFELKSTSFCLKNGIYIPKETMAITMLNPKEVLSQSFFDSHVWTKLKSMIFCAVEWCEPNDLKSRLLAVSSIDILIEDDFYFELEEDYNLIRQTLLTSGLNGLSGKIGKWMQPRTKGAGHGSTSRAFYLRKNAIVEILKGGNSILPLPE